MPEYELCGWCGGTTDPRSVCPKSIECPTCHEPAGRRCKRPSGHTAMTMHRDRYETAEAMDAAAGIVYEAVSDAV